ncbi:uncharacterized protein LOC109708111 isoform X2 [Ananas comosus]|uniref:Uncharacterized protein LOC109708111 isoform X2 n=1 Tax=Ananas comosus TaxID=4615 RepID=A0A6P5EVK5_ANACO|nr:uncharacterized protein LOC109708111 isoform X2 [Ananas comosus]
MHTVSKRGYGSGLHSSAWSFISCFCDSSDKVTSKPSSSSSVSRWGSSPWWRSRLRRTKRTVPAENAAAVAATRGRGTARWRRFFERSRKNQHQRQQQQDPKDPVHATVDRTMRPVHHVASRCTAGNSEPSLLYSMVDPVHARMLTTSHRTSPEHGGRRLYRLYEKLGFCGELDASAGLPVLAVVLAVMLLCGRLCAVFCMAAWFYVLPRFRLPESATGSSSSTMTSETNSKAAIADVDSEEYKKMVVLKGFLERDPRRPPMASSLSSHA